MKINDFCLVAILIAISLQVSAQLQIKTGGSVSITGDAAIQFHNTGLENNGNFNPGTGAVIFTGNAPMNNTVISGDSISVFHDLIIDKEANGIMLNSHISVGGVLGFNKGDLDINNFDVDLGISGSLVGEHDSTGVISDADGVVRSFREITSLIEENFGNVGLHLTSEEYLGWCVVERGHEPLLIGNENTINRHFYFKPEIDEDHSLQIQMDYFDAHIANFNETDLRPHQKIDSSWLIHSNHLHDTLFNSFLSQGIATESFISLSHFDATTISVKEALKQPKTISLDIWPNPANREVNVDIGHSFKRGQYMVMTNITGQVLRMMNVDDQVIKIERKGLPAGSYILEIKENGYRLGIGKIIWE